MVNRIALLCLLGICSSPIFAQIDKFSPETQKEHKREIGFTVNSLNGLYNGNYSAFYKKRLKDDRFLRLSGNADLGYTPASVFVPGGFNTNFNFSLGFENRKEVSQKVTLYQGFEYGVGLHYVKPKEQIASWNSYASVGYVMGLQYHFNKRLGILAEVTPQIGYSNAINNVRGLYDHDLRFRAPVSFGLFMKL